MTSAIIKKTHLDYIFFDLKECLFAKRIPFLDSKQISDRSSWLFFSRFLKSMDTHLRDYRKIIIYGGKGPAREARRRKPGVPLQFFNENTSNTKALRLICTSRDGSVIKENVYFPI